jgi:hypothetical protein
MPVGLLLFLVLVAFALYFDQHGSVPDENLGQPIPAAFGHRHKNNAAFGHRYKNNQNSSNSSR